MCFIGFIVADKIYLCIYVDDGLLTSENKSAIFKILEYLRLHFQITSDVESEYVGFEIAGNREKRLIKVGQAGYIRKVFEKFVLSEANALSLPAAPGSWLEKTKQGCSNFPYREAISSLLFVARVSRPDIEFSVNFVSQFCHNHEH